MSQLLEAALGFAAQGQPVFPCVVGGKVPATPNGFKNATTDEGQIRAWWSRADYNIGLPTGIIFDVIDVDGPDGMDALEEWADEYAVGLLTPTVITPSGGYHVYYRPTGKGNRAGMLKHVDYRGAGGYVLVPPSRTENGEYRWNVSGENMTGSESDR